MSFKNILVALAPGAKTDSGRDFAVSMGAALKAHVKACCYAIEPQLGREGWMDLPAELVETHLTELTKEAESSAKKFLEAAKRAKVQASHETYRAPLAAAKESFAKLASVHDVTVVAQSSKGLEHVGDVLTEAALFSSGRPLIVVPKSGAGDFSSDRLLIAWDGSAHAARAVAFSMPILALAKKIEVLVVGDKSKAKSSRAKDIVTNLERHGFDVELTCRSGEDDAGIIAREAKVGSASLLVMGGFGHSRLRELIFGGVTRYMLTNARLPVLLAH